MYFQIENTPEHIKRARRSEKVPQESPKEECPRLILAPFNKPPQVVFDNVLIGSSCERDLELFNPSKQSQQITLGKALPPDLVIQLPGERLELEPETCYCVTLRWTPMQPTAMRETIRFVNENRGRYDVIVVLKAVWNIKGRNQHKTFKLSPGKIKKQTKKSPVKIYKKKAELIFNTTTRIQKTVNIVHTTQHQVYETSNKENLSNFDNYSTRAYAKCPFDSPTSNDVNFDTSEIFSNMRILQETYEKSHNANRLDVPRNVLKPSNILNTSPSNIFDNLTFTPLKSNPSKKLDEIDNGLKIIVNDDSECEFDDSLHSKNIEKENQTHSILSITTAQPGNKWLTANQQTNIGNQIESPIAPSKKHPNTSSPKEFNSPNFSINTDFSRISDLSFFPTRFSTERKCFPKPNETHEIIDDKLSTDTYTKSPITPVLDLNMYPCDRPPHFFMRDQPKMCRRNIQLQQQFSNDKYYLNSYDYNVRPSELCGDLREGRSPPRSITPPLQSIPEESAQCSETLILDKGDQQMETFTINRTFEAPHDRSTISTTGRKTWAKKAVRCESDLWKVPESIKKSTKSKSKPKESFGSKFNTTFDSNMSLNANLTFNQIGNVYSQSSTVDPFLSCTYFYDEKAVAKFENEFKRWLNCILTPPADLDSNDEQKIDLGKAWIENRNKEVPLAPTKEYVSNLYHNSHRLVSLRKSARALFLSPEIAQVFLKLNAQIEKKLIAIRTDRNLHLDVGLQKTIMELILSYNPLWLRIGLEAIYGTVLPLKSNNDIERITIFVVQRMFKNPYLKNKHSKSSAPNMLLPAYIEAIKKFTLKKFFMLVFFLDQAKQRKLIQHDPCLFCRNAICKESREIVIRFTREVIAGIGDITKHLRPLGYVVSHKQSYLDEYKYAVHNLALDIKDGVRLTKVMEIIMMKNGLLNQLRTPAISRLQKIHNVQVAMNALKEAKFNIVGDISAADIADGHREKTLSLLWQLIHVFRAPLFEKAANVIQIWWRKKYEVIVEKRKEEEKLRMRLTNAACIIQLWWRRIQYNRQIELQMQRVTTSTIVVQKYCRMWLCRTRYRRIKTSVLKIESWYTSIKLMKEARMTLKKLWLEQEELRRRSAIIIQSCVRRWLCVKRYTTTIKKIIHLQASIRRYVERSRFLRLQKSTIFIQQKYKGKLLMRSEMQTFAVQKRSVILIQSWFKMMKQRRSFVAIKKSVIVLENRYIALMKMREERKRYLELRRSVIKTQALFRSKKCQINYTKQRNTIIYLQHKFRANREMNIQRAKYFIIRKAVITLQMYTKSYLKMKNIRHNYLLQRKSAILIQNYFRSYLLAKSQRNRYLQLRKASIIIQTRYRSLLLMKKNKSGYINLKTAAICMQRRYRAQIEMRKCKDSFSKLLHAVKSVQQRYRALIQMREQRTRYVKLKRSCMVIQTAYKAHTLGKRERASYLKLKEAAIRIQRWYRNCKAGKKVQTQFLQKKQACVTIQTYYKAYIMGRSQRQEYIRIKTAIITIQKFYRSYIETKTIRHQFIKIKSSTVTIQRFCKSRLEMKKQRAAYLQMKSAVACIEKYYQRHKQYQMARNQYLALRKATIFVQRRHRSVIAMRSQRKTYLDLKKVVIAVQQRYRALLSMRSQMKLYKTLRAAVVVIQTRYRAQRLMKETRILYIKTIKSCVSIQRFYKGYKTGLKQRQDYLKLKQITLKIQRWYRAVLAMRKERNTYSSLRKAAVSIQRRFRAHRLMLKTRDEYAKTLIACKIIQRKYRAYLEGKRQREEYMKLKRATILIQTHYRMLMETRKVRHHYLIVRSVAVMIQRRFRANMLARSIKQNEAATKIQTWYKSAQQRNACRRKYLHIRKCVIKIQSVIRMFIHSNRFLEFKSATLTIQKYYRTYKQAKLERQSYLTVRTSIIKLQSFVRCFIQRRRYLSIRSSVLMVQAMFRLKRHRAMLHKRKVSAAICLQKYIRRYLVQSWYRRYRQNVVFIQQIWKGKLLTRLIRCDYIQQRRFIIKIQSYARGYLIRKQVQLKREHYLKIKQEKRENWAASIIVALFRGNKARMQATDSRVAAIRRRWREGALKSTQPTIRQRNDSALEVLRNMSGIDKVIEAFRCLEMLTGEFPKMYDNNAASIVRRIFLYMSYMNRSTPCLEVLKFAAGVLINLARYKVTGPKIYDRERNSQTLTYMLRSSTGELELFCKLATYLWLFSKYDGVREDMTEFLHLPENHKMLLAMKSNAERAKRMITNMKYSTPQPKCSGSNSSFILPAIDPDFGIVRENKPKHFEDAYQAICCLFSTYNL